MLFRHRMGDRDKLFVLYIFDDDFMVFVCILGFQRGKSNAATAYYGISGTMNNVSTDGTNIEFAPEHIGGNVFVGNMLAVHQLNDRDSQCLRQWLK